MQDDKPIKSEINNNNQCLYELLRQKRNEIAKEVGLEPFKILHNKHLREIVEKQPKSIEEIASIKGIGIKKALKYGQFILEIIKDLNLSSPVKTHKEEKIFSVSEYIDSLNQILTPQTAIIIGEVSNVSPRVNYTFFSLHDKNADALLNCFVWQNRLEEFAVELKEGLELKIAGFPKIYERYGKLTFEVEYLGLIGEGALKIALEKLKKKLEVEGYFALERKKALPKYVTRIGLITSGFGDAKNDFLTHLNKFGLKIYFYDVRVEGLYAVEDITEAIRWFNENLLGVEVLVLTRGGGSLESLQAFNSEAVAKAIFSSKIPIINGVGHENDITIADLVADVRASTPTDAAKILSDPWKNGSKNLSIIGVNIVSLFLSNLKNYLITIESSEKNLYKIAKEILATKLSVLNNLQNNLGYQFGNLLQRVKETQLLFSNNQEILKRLTLGYTKEINSLEQAFSYENKRWLTYFNNKLLNIEQKLNLGSPEIRLKQGYSIILSANKKIVKSCKQIKFGDILNLKFHRGGASSKVERIYE